VQTAKFNSQTRRFFLSLSLSLSRKRERKITWCKNYNAVKPYRTEINSLSLRCIVQTRINFEKKEKERERGGQNVRFEFLQFQSQNLAMHENSCERVCTVTRNNRARYKAGSLVSGVPGCRKEQCARARINERRR